MKITASCHKEEFSTHPPHILKCIYLLVELPEEAHSAENHSSSLRLFSLGAGHS